MAMNAHTLTVKFHRFLSEAEWRAVVAWARQIPYVQELVANAVEETPAELARGQVPFTAAPLPEEGELLLHRCPHCGRWCDCAPGDEPAEACTHVCEDVDADDEEAD